jgi:hypothetical protein
MDTAVEFAQRIKRWEAKKIRENPSNHNEITAAFQRQFGWGDYEPWCAESVTVISEEGGVLPAGCASAGAWDLTNRLVAAGFGRTLDTIHFPGVISFNYGTGHIGFLLGLTLDHLWGYTAEGNTGAGNSGNEGDGFYFRKRYLGGGAVHQVCDLEFAKNKAGLPVGKPARPFLHLANPPMRGQAVLNVRHALIVAGNKHLDPNNPVFDQEVANLVNLYNHNHGIKVNGQDAHGVTTDTWNSLGKLVHG